MLNNHISDEILQAYILENKTDINTSIHMAECEACKQRAEMYRALNNALNAVAAETFPFDVSKMVIQKIEAEQQKEKHITYALFTLVAIVFVVIAYLGAPILVPFFKTFKIMSGITALFMLTVTLVITLFLVMDMLRVQKEKELLLFQ